MVRIKNRHRHVAATERILKFRDCISMNNRVIIVAPITERTPQTTISVRTNDINP